MRGLSAPAVLVVLVCMPIFLAGCTGETEPSTDDDAGVVVVTAPDDFSSLDDPSSFDKPHLHDYWGGLDEKVVLSTTGRAQAGFWGTGEALVLQRFWPDVSDVVPLGTAEIRVTATWTEDPDAVYGDTELWVKTAADADSHRIDVLEQGATVTVPVTNAQADLPHQTLSGWAFDFAATADPEAGFGRFDGQVTIEAVAVRGLDIALFPGHPDHWHNATRLPVLAVSNEVVFFQGDAGGGSCLSGCIIDPHVPTDGAIVPRDTATVKAYLNYTSNGATDIELWYHGADARGHRPPDDIESTGASPGDVGKVYTIPVVGNMGDGPYANASQWEFRIVAMTPEPPNGNWSGSYTLEVIASRV